MAGVVQTTDNFNGLQAGRLVNFVTKNGYIRPLLVLIAWQGTNLTTEDDPTGAKPKPSGRVNGIVFRDGPNDDSEFTRPDALSLPSGSDGGNVIIPPPAVRLAEWAVSVEYNADHAPGTWHWPPKGESTVSFVTEGQLIGLLQNHDEQIEKSIRQWLADFKKQQFEDANAVVEVEGLPIEDQEINTLREEVANIQKILAHHGLNGPAEVQPEQAALIPSMAGTSNAQIGGFSTMPADSIVQTPGHEPQSGQMQIGGKSKGGNDGEANAAALQNK